jgi:plasmid stabilization system protein ParE
MRVIIEESAIADIDGLAPWLAKDSPQRARSMVQRILETIERLNLFPEMGTRVLMQEHTSAGVGHALHRRVRDPKRPSEVLVHGARDR